MQRRWEDGSLLRGYATGVAFEEIEVPLRGPSPSQIGDDLQSVRQWVDALVRASRDGGRYTLTWKDVGGRRIGRNSLPVRAVLSTYDQAWDLLGVHDVVHRFDRVLDMVSPWSPVREWVLSRPHQSLELESELPQLTAAFAWLDARRGSGRYLREITAPGVDTKFTERHRGVLAAMLGVRARPQDFVSDLGLASKPEFVRLRLSGDVALLGGMMGGVSEMALRADELAALNVRSRSVLIIENEVTYLSVPPPPGGMVLWGKGFEVDRIGRLPWLADAEVVYWGDIDTHGFAILDRLRAFLPAVRSVLMDRGTLLAHRESWVLESKPSTAALTRLRPDEESVYLDLVTDRLGDRVRLEQECIGWDWVLGRLGIPD